MTNKKTTEVKDKKVGRPKVEINWELMDGILQFGARLIDCREILGVSDDTIQNNIRQKFGMTFSEYRDQKMSKIRIKLLQKQFESAMAGNTALLIFLGKQYLGQSEKVQTRNEHISPDGSFKVSLSKEEKLEMIEKYKKSLEEDQ